MAAVEETVKYCPTALYTFSMSLNHLRDAVSELLARKITASERIQSLSADYVLEQWVRRGMALHQKDSKVCLFCGSQIFDSRWSELKMHFDRATETLRIDIEEVLKKIDSHRNEFEREYNLNKQDFYSTQYQQVEDVITVMDGVRTKYLSLLSSMKEQLAERERNITQSCSFDDDDSVDALAMDAAKKYADLRKGTIEYTTSINNKIKDAQARLLYNEVLLFIQEIDYVGRKQKVDRLEKVKDEKEKAKSELETEIKVLEDELQEIDTQITSVLFSKFYTMRSAHKYLCHKG